MGVKHEQKKGKSVFNCSYCYSEVKPIESGSIRNHCPHCLHSIHLDITPGDRLNDCMGLMEPVSIKYHSKKGYQITHECLSCGHKQNNIIADDDDYNLICLLDFR